MIRFGVAETCITPDLGVELAGYGPDLKRRAVRVHDDLYAQALVLDDDEQAVALVAADLFGISATAVAEIRDLIARSTGIPGENVLIAASHAHTAPTAVPTRMWGDVDVGYVERLMQLLPEAVVAARRRLEPAMIASGIALNDAYAYNRVDGWPDTLIDPHLAAVGFQAGGSRSGYDAMIVSYGCHPVVPGPSPEVSADFPGALRGSLKQRWPECTALFFTGACGDVDPLTNRERWGSGTHDDVRRMGAGLGDAAARAIGDAPTRHADGPLHVARSFVRLAYDLPDVPFLHRRIDQLASDLAQPGAVDAPFGNVNTTPDLPHFWLAHYRDLLERIESGRQPSFETIELQRIDIGPSLTLVGIPAEVYASQGLAIRGFGGTRLVLPLGYANGLVGYLPPMSEYDRGGYPASLAPAVNLRPPFERGSAERVQRAIQDLLG